jgi:ADP-dependent NAD(P)H-hydrate dehydratase / NAD(P)H-hydrate epimerase
VVPGSSWLEGEAMKLATSLQMRECDRRTIAGENLPAPTAGLVLMERAGWGIYAALRQRFDRLAQRPILVFCGRGNNGGDGLVVARLLMADRRDALAVLTARPAELSADARVQYDRLVAAGGRILELAGPEDVDVRLAGELRTASRLAPLVIDALLGTGSRGAPQGLIGACVEWIHQSRDRLRAQVVAVDLPTGVDADTGQVPGAAVRADLTVTLAYAKVGFCFYPGREHVGCLHVADIGIPPSVEADVGLPLAQMDAAEAGAHLPVRPGDAHKGRVGRLFILGGSPGLTGAPSLTALAALRAGAGLVTIGLPAGLNLALEAKLTEVMTLPLAQTPAGSLAPEAEPEVLARRAVTDVWVVGPGLGREPGALTLARSILRHAPGRLVVDADGLYALSGDVEWWRPADSPPAILTPHPGEMARLQEKEPPAPGAAAWESAAAYARAHRCVLVLKGAPTIVAAPDGRIWINPTGNSGMATGGTGDALTGVIAALLGQGLGPVDAARLGVYLHGYAGDLAGEACGPVGLLPTDLIAALPRAWRLLLAARL